LLLLRTRRPFGTRRTLLLRSTTLRSALLSLLLLLLLLRTFPVALPLLLAIAALRAIGARAALLFRARLPRPLLVFADLFLHEPPRLLVEPRPQLVMAAVRAALPSLGIGAFTAGAKDGFRERHRRIGAHCTLRASGRKSP
jgi:hypothetical protein